MKIKIVIDNKDYVIDNVDSYSINQYKDCFTVNIFTKNVTNDNNDDYESILNTLIKSSDEDNKVTTQSFTSDHSNTLSNKNNTDVLSKKIPIINSSSIVDEKSAVVRVYGPSPDGILVDEDNRIDGKSFPINEEVLKILNQTRKDFGVNVITNRENLELFNNKKNVILRSEPFKQINDINIKVAIQTLVLKEQQLSQSIVVSGKSRDMIENFIYIEEPTKLVVQEIKDEREGTGVFIYEEVVSVYKGTFLRTSNNKG